MMNAVEPPVKHSIRKRARYRLDMALSRGPSVVITWLAILTLALILLTAAILTIFQLTGVNGDPDNSLGCRRGVLAVADPRARSRHLLR